MYDWMEYLKLAVAHQASDLFFVVGRPVCEKLDGHIRELSDKRLETADTERILTEIFAFSGHDIADYHRRWDMDFSFSIPGLARFRINSYRQRGSAAAVIRIISFDIPDWQQLHIPPAVMAVAEQTSGLVLVTGTAGSGKTTTQACILDQINRQRECHIITLEDPIEYLHRHRKSIVSQREVSSDTRDYHTALRACVRQSPDVILLGEVRDEQTMQIAMSAAETGHMVIATLHTKGAVNAIERIIDAFPSSQQGQIRVQLAMVLNTVISQQLLPGKDGHMIPACEIMHVNSAICSMIRDNKSHQINNAIAAGGSEGMITMDQSILSLLHRGYITQETALHYADRPEAIRRGL